MDDSINFVKDLVEQTKGQGPIINRQEKTWKDPNLDPSETEGLPPIVPGSEFPPQYELVKRKPLVENLFRVGDNVLLTAPSKMGKSWFYSTLATSLASGEKFLGLEVAKSRVLMLDLELHKDDAQDRLWSIALAQGLKQVPEDLYLWSLRSCVYDMETLIEVLQARLADLPAMDAIFIDPIYMLEGGGEFDENSNSAVTAMLRELQGITKQTGSALLLSHHYRKGNMGRENHIDRSSGAGAFSRFPDSLLTLSHHNEPYHAIMEVTGRSMPQVKARSVKMIPPLITGSQLPVEFKRYTT
jgi:RecA-family ATPase